MNKSMAADDALTDDALVAADDEDANDAVVMVGFRYWDFGCFCCESLRCSASFVFFCVPKSTEN